LARGVATTAAYLEKRYARILRGAREEWSDHGCARAESCALERLIEQARRDGVAPFQIEHALDDAATILRMAEATTIGLCRIIVAVWRYKIDANINVAVW
jgi:hypothetical protein